MALRKQIVNFRNEGMSTIEFLKLNKFDTCESVADCRRADTILDRRIKCISQINPILTVSDIPQEVCWK